MKNLRRPIVFVAAVVGIVFAVRDGCGYLRHQQNLVWQNQRLPELRKTMQGAAPIIAAIRKYEKDHGRPPERLQELVPRYLPIIPSPGNVSRSINWEYIRTISPREGGSEEPHNDKWSLGIQVRGDFCPRCYSFGDWFMYHPSSIYPQVAYGGVLEKVDDWGYYHE
jgi:hypothetical protein